MARKAKCTCVTPSMAHGLCPCFRTRSILTTASPSEHAPPPPRCLLLGLSGSGKTTFLYRVKTGEFFDVKPTSSFVVEEILINKKGDTMTFSEVGGTDRRNIRLQFLQSLPLLGISILFFIDVTSSPEALRVAFEELIYVLSYTQARGCSIHYLGIVLNKQDLLNPPASRIRRKETNPSIDLEKEWPSPETDSERSDELLEGQSSVVKWIKKEVYEAMEEYKLSQPEEFHFTSELLHTGPDGRGVSMRTGDGVQEVFGRLIAGSKAGREKAMKKKSPLGLDQIAAGAKIET